MFRAGVKHRTIFLRGPGKSNLHHSLPGDSLASQACPQLYPRGLQAMSLSTNPALCLACARKHGGFPTSGRGGQLLVWRLLRPLGCPSRNSQPLPAQALPGNPAPPPPAPHTGPMFPWWLTRSAQAGPCLSLSILTLGNNLVGRRTTACPPPEKSFTVTVDLRCLLQLLFSCYAMGSTNWNLLGFFCPAATWSLCQPPGVCGGNLDLLEGEWTGYSDSDHLRSGED